ncbi:uncharacterized protein [Channa argus]|uniref:uncharacterized protein n=1 Tax=Channa argus TaxID=215402 RepID=UPI0035230280
MRQRRTMAEFRRILMVLFLILIIHFTAGAEQETGLFVRDGDDVTLQCEIANHHNRCDNTTWLFSGLGNTAVTLFEHGKIHNNTDSKPDRLSVTENCSLVIKKVTDEDVGHYSCRQFDKSGRQQGSDSVVYLSVVTTTATIEISDASPNQQDVDTKTATTKSMGNITESSTNQGGSTATSDAATKLQGLLRLIIVSVGLTTLIIIVVTVEVWSRSKGTNTSFSCLSTTCGFLKSP